MAEFRQLVADLRRAQKLALGKSTKAKPKERNKALREARRLEGEVDQALPSASGELAEAALTMRELQTRFWEERNRMTPSARYELLREALAAEAAVDSIFKPRAHQPSLLEGGE
jgi:hypothetical protein